MDKKDKNAINEEEIEINETGEISETGEVGEGVEVVEKKENLRRLNTEEEYNVNFLQKIDKRRMACAFGLTAIAIVLCFLPISVPLTSNMFAVDFSVLPELIGALAYGPLVGAAICFVKYFIHLTFVQTALFSDISNFFVDVIYIAFTSIFYSTHMYMADNGNKTRRFERGKAIIKGSLLGIIPAMVFQFLSTEFFVFPKIEKHYARGGVTYESIIGGYISTINALRNHLPEFIAKHIPDIKGIWMGILMVNIPISVIKLLIVTFLAAIIYNYASPFLHGRYKTRVVVKQKKPSKRNSKRG